MVRTSLVWGRCAVCDGEHVRDIEGCSYEPDQLFGGRIADGQMIHDWNDLSTT